MLVTSQRRIFCINEDMHRNLTAVKGPGKNLMFEIQNFPSLEWKSCFSFRNFVKEGVHVGLS